MRPALAAKKNGGFDPNIFLATIAVRLVLTSPLPHCGQSR
jgi:hypothetical protein